MQKNDKIPRKRINEAKELFCFLACERVKTYYGTLDKFLAQMEYLKSWDRKSNAAKSAYTKSWATVAEYRNRFNACFGVPSGLLKDILGYGRDPDGKLFRYSPT